MKKVFSKIQREIAYYRTLITHPKTPRLSRWLLIAAIAYFLSPIDLIPDGIPILGQLDDLLIVPGLIFAALALVPKSVKQECREMRRTLEESTAGTANRP